jgi:hypothetical protein
MTFLEIECLEHNKSKDWQKVELKSPIKIESVHEGIPAFRQKAMSVTGKLKAKPRAI